MSNLFSPETESIVDLQKFKLEENILYIEGIGIIVGHTAKEYSDIDYQLIVAGNSGTYIKKLAKSHRPELTRTYAVNTDLSYDKCWFATPRYQGVDISDIPVGNYELLLQVTIDGCKKVFSLCSQESIQFKDKLFIFESNAQGNKLEVKPKTLTIKFIKLDGSVTNVNDVDGIKFNIIGTNNVVTIYEGTKFRNCYMSLVSNMNIVIGKSRYGITGLKIFGDDSNVTIGQNFSCWGTEIRCHEPKSEVHIGNDCMFSEEIVMYPTDVHSIYDNDTKEVLNLAEPIFVGDHVWCGRGVCFLKGSYISNDSVVGMGSVVTKKFNLPNSIIAGFPAKIIKSNINWDRRNPFQYKASL